MNIHDVMEALYASEINCSISSFWDGGYEVKLGDELNGFKVCESVDTLEDAAIWLGVVARQHYPDSVYAKRRHCCRIGCGKLADYVVVYGFSPDDFTYSCLADIPEMMTDAGWHEIVRLR